MNANTIAVIVAVAIATATLAGAILPGQYAMQRDVAELRERMARLEGLIEGFTRRELAARGPAESPP